MAKFRYVGLDEKGGKVKGVVEADHANEARIALAERGFRSLRLKERPSFLQTEITRKRISRVEIMHFSRQLAAFVRAGVPMLDAIDTLRGEMRSDRFREVLADIAESLRSGETFSGAVAAHGDVFPGFYVAILRSAEMTGQIDAVLDQLAAYIERDESAKRKIRSALTYPLVIVAVAIVAIVVLVTFALPRFRTFFRSLDADLPFVTRMLMSITNFIGDYWWAMIGGSLAIVLALFLYQRTPDGRRARDRFFLRMPLMGDLVRFTIVERFCRILGSMVRSGVPVPDAMAVATNGTNNVVFRRALTGAREAMMRGEGMAEPLAATGLFPGAATQMMRVGENTGTLDDQLVTAADFYGKEAEYKIDKLTSIFEPAIIVTVGVVVGFVAIALVSAMYGIFRQVKVR